ncbi:hypothetical protein CDL12_05911 [Handroanthus impetiginosus]|uniref:PRC-barrel domain-containing protein n=1 Tax=Handroanthus impetiginosus TaxID=429701 RepID=A0A2G9HV21_9LAMI|nr:hypothetical protein CDL12_05911 [Handroanthus impetiginosus]
MCDCLPSIKFSPQNSVKTHKFWFTTCFKLPKYLTCSILDSTKSSISINSTRDWGAIPFTSNEHLYEELDFGLLEKEEVPELRLRRDQQRKKDESGIEEPAGESEIDEEADDLSIGETSKFRGQEKDNKLVKEDGISKPQGLDCKLDELERHQVRCAVEVAKGRGQMVRRSNIMAKQVISISSALSLGFVSQLWVDTSSWVVIGVEVRPNLLSGDFERFLLKEIRQVGDVILIKDENVIEDGLKLVGLDTLVGYTVVTPSRQRVGKVRGYTFDINSGLVESLEIDSFGISVIPASLVSTYALFVEDVVEVLSDIVVVRETAVSRIQRLTKGFWDGRNAGTSNNDFEEQLEVYGNLDPADYSGRRHRNLPSQKIRRKIRKRADDWELPMDYM